MTAEIPEEFREGPATCSLCKGALHLHRPDAPLPLLPVVRFCPRCDRRDPT